MFRNAPAGLRYPGDAGFPGKTGLDRKWWNLAPRAGVAWDVRGDGRLALRSSYGLSYDYPTGEFLSNPVAAPPFGNRIRLTDPPGGFDNPYGHLPGAIRIRLFRARRRSTPLEGRSPPSGRI